MTDWGLITAWTIAIGVVLLLLLRQNPDALRNTAQEMLVKQAARVRRESDAELLQRLLIEEYDAEAHR